MKKRLITALLSSVILSSCSIAPQDIKTKEQYNNTFNNLYERIQDQKPVVENISLSDAIARALKYNLDYKVKKVELMLEQGNLTLAYLEMLPEFNISSGYSWRNNQRIQYNTDGDGNIDPNNTSDSTTPRELTDFSAIAQWNILDLGLSYVRAKQQESRVLIAEEEKRKLIQEIIQQVMAQYWRASTAQELLVELDKFKEKTKEALQRSIEASSSKVSSQKAELQYQQALIQVIRKANQLSIQLANAKLELAKLINVPQNQNFVLDPPKRTMEQLPNLTTDLEKLDTLALIYRPELRSASYETKIAERGVQETILEALPGITIDFGYNYTSNKYMQNKTWLSSNVRLSWNLIDALIKAPYAIDFAQHRVKYEQLKQAAVTMSVLTQVRIAYKNYSLWRDEYYYAEKEAKVSQDLYDYTLKLKSANLSNSQLEIQQGMDALVSQFEKDNTFAKTYEALGMLYQTVGVDLLDTTDIDTLDLQQLQSKVKVLLNSQSKGGFNDIIDEKYNIVSAELKSSGTTKDGVSVNLDSKNAKNKDVLVSNDINIEENSKKSKQVVLQEGKEFEPQTYNQDDESGSSLNLG